jgi:hypothetical protein
MRNILALGIIALLTAPSFAKDSPAEKRKPAAADCSSANKELAQTIINNAAKRISNKASDVSLNWVNATGERYVYSGSIYKGEYEIIVKTDSSCFPLEVELVDLARK